MTTMADANLTGRGHKIFVAKMSCRPLDFSEDRVQANSLSMKCSRLAPGLSLAEKRNFGIEIDYVQIVS